MHVQMILLLLSLPDTEALLGQLRCAQPSGLVEELHNKSVWKILPVAESKASRTGSGTCMSCCVTAREQQRVRARQGDTCRITEDEAGDEVIPITERAEKQVVGNYSTY